MQEHVAGRLCADIFALHLTEQVVEVITVLACGVTGDPLQQTDVAAQLGLQLRHQRRGQGQDKAFHVRRKLKPVDAQRRDDLNRRLLQNMALALDFNLRSALVHIEQLAQVGMPMGADLPIVDAAAQRDGFAVQQVGAEPVLLLTVKLEHRD